MRNTSSTRTARKIAAAVEPIRKFINMQPLQDRLEESKPKSLLQTLANLDAGDRIRVLCGMLSPRNFARRTPLRSLILNYVAAENWLEMTKLELGLQQEATALIRKGSWMDVTPGNFFIYDAVRFAAWKKMKAGITEDGEAEFRAIGGSRIENLKFKLAPGSMYTLYETFFQESYALADFQRKVVLDIGANIGDTAIYFALRGAGHVYSLEPYPKIFEIARQNVWNNGFGNQVTLINGGLSENSGGMTVENEKLTTGSNDLVASKSGKIVPLYTLQDLVGMHGLENAVLKMDCEGGGYAILKSANETLRSFSEVIMEYHYGYANIVKKLEGAGFHVTLMGNPHYGYNRFAQDPHFVTGILWAKQR